MKQVNSYMSNNPLQTMRYSFCLYSKKSSVLKNYSVVVTVSVILLLGVTNLEPVSAQKYDSLLTLDSLPSKISEGKSVIFSGKIVTGSGYPISGAVVQIKDDVSFGRDKVIRTATTDKDGKFYVSWKATSRSSGSYDLYAVYGGNDQIGKSRSFSYTVSVGPSHVQDSSSDYNAKYLVSTRITLDRIPSSVYAGDTVTFTGKVTSNGYAVSGAVVQIKDDVSYGRDKVIRTVTTDKYGKFYVSWKAIQKNSGSYNLYAVYGGNDSFDKSRSLPYTVSVSSSHVQDSSSDYNTKTDPVSTRITLDRIPSSVYAGDTVTFTGKVTSNGYAVSGAVVQIKDDVSYGRDKVIKTATTDKYGKFYVSWKAIQKNSGSYNLYAVYGGNDSFDKSRSLPYTVSVSSSHVQDSSSDYNTKTDPVSTRITLDRIPSSVYAGDTVTFTGKVTSNGQTISGVTIQIKDDVSYGRDKVIKTATTDKYGKFHVSWKAIQKNSGSYNLYAVYGGNDLLGKPRSLPYTVSVSSSHVQDSSSDYNAKTDPVSTRITLDRIPSSVYAGDTVTFTGKVTSNGQAISNAIVYIKEDDPGPDQRLTMVRTDSNGKFKSVWKVTAGLFEKDFDVYAVFEGNSSYKRDRSHNQTMTVLKHGGSIVLDSFPSSAKIGDMITFSGKLEFTKKETQGAIVYIKDEDFGNPDDLLATAYVNSSGKFSADWRVTKVDWNNTADIYAVFEGSGIFNRITTCDKDVQIPFR